MGGGGVCIASCQDWSNCAYTTYMRVIRHSVLDRNKNCESHNALCGKGGSCFKNNGAGLCVSKCKDGDDDWGIVPLCTGKSCEAGYNYVAGVCWESCGNNTDVGALCREKCSTGEDEVAGVCWGTCGGDIPVGALCRENCKSGEDEVLGVCWGTCGGDIPVGALCRENCREGFHEVLGVCWGNVGTYARAAMLPKTITVYDPGYSLPNKSRDLDFPVCNYADPVMMDRMAQFYYDQSTLHAKLLADGRLSYEFIVMIYGVIASSEFSCDIACAMKTVTFDPVSGDNYTESYGTINDNDPGNTTSYRRFYFGRTTTDKNADTVDDCTGSDDRFALFTVTGCTNADGTAPRAQVKSTDEGVDPPISVPKIFQYFDKGAGKVTFDMNTFKTSLASTATMFAVNVGVGAAASAGPFGTAGNAVVGGIGGGIAGGMAGEAVTNAMNKAQGVAQSLGKTISQTIIGNQTDGFYIATNNDYYSINHGPIYETRAATKSGYVPTFSFCGKIITTETLCTHANILRDTIARYEQLNKNKHVKEVLGIEPRGKDGCYYNWTTVSYDSTTNKEGTSKTTEEVVRQYEIKDFSTCVWTPTDRFVGTGDYPIRSYFDTLTQTTIYPTRRTKSVPVIKGRYVRIRPSQTAKDTILQISQVAVYNALGKNAAEKKPVTSTSSSGGQPVSKVVDGMLMCLSGIGNNFQMNGPNEYIEIDTGYMQLISTVFIYGMLDSSDTSRYSGIRVEILDENRTSLKELATTTAAVLDFVDFSRKDTNQFNVPNTPFIAPQPLPSETTLGSSCPARCQDKPQIDSLVEQFNAIKPTDPTKKANQIIKVLRAVTAASDRCDYEVEMIRDQGNNKTTVGKELISMKVSQDSSTTGGVVYGRYVRMVPAANGAAGPLSVSQIVVVSNGVNVALNKPVYATSKYYGFAPPSIIVDGNTDPRLRPNYWVLGNRTGTNEHIEIDLGRPYPISRIVYCPPLDVDLGFIGNARIQILDMNGTFDTPIWDVQLKSITTPGPQEVVFNQCKFKFSSVTYDNAFIQDNTPYLQAIDTSGGVLTFDTIGTKLMNAFNSLVQPLIDANPMDTLDTKVAAAETSVINLTNTIGATLPITRDCPNVKCTDTAVMKAIMKRYNTDSSAPTKQFGTVTNTMTQISAAGTGSPGSCDVLFTELYNQYEDFLYDPLITKNNTLAKRFKMANTGNCTMDVASGSTSITDISANAFGLTSKTAVLQVPFANTVCQVNCRDPTLLSKIKASFDSKTSTRVSTYDQSTTTVLQNLKTVTQSFQRTPSLCEYMALKDVTTKSTSTNKFSTEPGVSTYLTASVTLDSSCVATLQDVIEFDPDTTSSTNGTAYVNGAVMQIPYLMAYDKTNPSNKVKVTSQNL